MKFKVGDEVILIVNSTYFDSKGMKAGMIGEIIMLDSPHEGVVVIGGNKAWVWFNEIELARIYTGSLMKVLRE